MKNLAVGAEFHAHRRTDGRRTSRIQQFFFSSGFANASKIYTSRSEAMFTVIFFPGDHQLLTLVDNVVTVPLRQFSVYVFFFAPDIFGS